MAVTPIVYGLAQVPSATWFFVSQSSPFSRAAATALARSCGFLSSGVLSCPRTIGPQPNHDPRTRPMVSMRDPFIVRSFCKKVLSERAARASYLHRRFSLGKSLRPADLRHDAGQKVEAASYRVGQQLSVQYTMIGC